MKWTGCAWGAVEHISKSCPARKRQRTDERIISVVGIINSESGHLFPQVGIGVQEAESAEGR